MPTLPADIVNQALDLLGCPETIGDLEEGGPIASAALRHYGPTLRQVFRGAAWNFARKRASLTLLQDATGQTTQQQATAGILPGNPLYVGPGTVAMQPWVYEYAWPIDCVRARFVPATWCPYPGVPANNIGLPNPSAPPTTAFQSGLPYVRDVPTRFLVTNEAGGSLQGAITDWSQVPETAGIQGIGLTSRTVILSNQQTATLVYTAFISSPDQWDVSFRQAFVSILATFLAMPCLKDKKEARIVRDEQIKVAKGMLDAARISDGDEGWNTTDHIPDWIRTRQVGGYGGTWGGFGALGFDGGWGGVLGYGWGMCGLGDGSSY